MQSQWEDTQKELKDLKIKFATLFVGECGKTVGAAIEEYQRHPDLFEQFKIYCSLSDNVQTLKSEIINCNKERPNVIRKTSKESLLPRCGF